MRKSDFWQPSSPSMDSATATFGESGGGGQLASMVKREETTLLWSWGVERRWYPPGMWIFDEKILGIKMIELIKKQG